MNYQTYLPPKHLSQIVRYYWSFDSVLNSKADLLITSFADKYPRLIFQNLNDFDPIRTAEGLILPQCYLSGIDTQKSDYLMGNSFSHFGVSFYPHALKRLFKIDAHELINQLPDINLFGAIDLDFQLQNAASHLVRVDIISAFLFKKLDNYGLNDALVDALVFNQAITETSNIPTIQKKYKISERQLERKFNAFIGVSPKKLQRITRFEKALMLLQNAEYSQLTGIAYNLGYTDQSHFIKDFKSFSGFSPYAFITKNAVGAESSSFIFNPLDV